MRSSSLVISLSNTSSGACAQRMHIAGHTVRHDLVIANSYDPESLVNRPRRFELYDEWRNHLQLLAKRMSNGTVGDFHRFAIRYFGLKTCPAASRRRPTHAICLVRSDDLAKSVAPGLPPQRVCPVECNPQSCQRCHVIDLFRRSPFTRTLSYAAERHYPCPSIKPCQLSRNIQCYLSGQRR